MFLVVQKTELPHVKQKLDFAIVYIWKVNRVIRAVYPHALTSLYIPDL